jgi:osmotically-inducible protein OsmY
MEDKSLAPAPSNVITVVSKGVVKMTGYVRSRRAAQELHERIASLPGVVAIEDELTLWNGHKI